MSEVWKERVRRQLLQIPLRFSSNDFRGRASVLICLFDQGGKPSFLLTKRTQKVATHKGQICFPGGFEEPEDASLWKTALRETREEVGIKPGDVESLGRFHDYQAVTGQCVASFVGFLKGGFILSPSSAEVDRILKVPLSFFRDFCPRVEIRQRGDCQMPVYFYKYRGDLIWGLTAGMIKDLVKAVKI